LIVSASSTRCSSCLQGLDSDSPGYKIESNERSIGDSAFAATMAGSKQLSANGSEASTVRSKRGSRSYDRKLEAILRQAAAVFRSRGYHQASIRDIARATGVSLAGLYYYFSSKEELLFLIQRHAFETILAAAKDGLQNVESPEERLRTLIHLHLQFFLEHPNEMKVLTHEEEWLGKDRGRAVRAIKRAYYQLCLEQVQALKEARGRRELNTRLAVLSLFGMMNWIYTWYNPKLDPDAAGCAEAMADIFLHGILSGSAASSVTRPGRAEVKARGVSFRHSRSINGGSAQNMGGAATEHFDAQT
jgi:AcrR family transcriptional regulator